MTRGAAVFALLLAVLPGLAPAEAATPPGMVPFEIVVVPAGSGRARPVMAWDRDGVLYLGANEISWMLGLTKAWRPDLGRLILTGKSHRITVVEGTEVALIDNERVVHLPGEVFLWEGQMIVPLDLFLDSRGERRPWVDSPLAFSREARRLRLGGEKPGLRDASIGANSSGWTLRLQSTARLGWDLESADLSEFVVRLRDVSYDPLLLPLPTEHPWFQGLRLQDAGGGVEVRFTPGPGAAGFRVANLDTATVEIHLGLAPEDLARGLLRGFSASGAVLDRIRRVVIDPGHGGGDSGDAVPGGKESDLTWELARRIRERLEKDLDAEVFFTRNQNENPQPERRADVANRVRADLYLAVHLHSRKGGPAAFVVATDAAAAATPPTLDDLGFRPYGSGRAPHEAESRVVARALLESTAAALAVPGRGVHAEPLPELAGLGMPGVLLELGSDEKAKWTDERLDAVARAVAEGLEMAPAMARGE